MADMHESSGMHPTDVENVKDEREGGIEQEVHHSMICGTHQGEGCPNLIVNLEGDPCCLSHYLLFADSREIQRELQRALRGAEIAGRPDALKDAISALLGAFHDPQA